LALALHLHLFYSPAFIINFISAPT